MTNCQVDTYCAGPAVGRYVIDGKPQDRCVFHAGAPGELVEVYDAAACNWLARTSNSS